MYFPPLPTHRLKPSILAYLIYPLPSLSLPSIHAHARYSPVLQAFNGLNGRRRRPRAPCARSASYSSTRLSMQGQHPQNSGS